MTSDMLLVLIVGLVGGGVLGYLTAWRFARKLEHHEVVLADWDRPFDLQAPRDRSSKIVGIESRYQ